MRNVFLMALLLACTPLQALELRSGETRATLLELFTSEGCSSCPPADRWYTSLQTHPRLWQDLVPVAFHVDYWNYLGWDDRFSHVDYARRQRSFKAEGAASAVYTPGVMALGREWRDWRYRPGKPPVSSDASGVLSLSLSGDRVVAQFDPATTIPDQLELHIAVLGFGLMTPVKAGENRGELLRHDFVVLGHRRAPGDGNWELELPDSPYTEQASRLALAAWVSPRGSVQPLQAVGGWLDVPDS
ncbi:MAG: DUF1223 domain-containing protein [Pseudomonadota bacterium]